MPPLDPDTAAAIFLWLCARLGEREERLRADLLSDVHALAKWRVIGPLSNVPDFYEAFGVKPGQPMWRPPAERIQIW
jgi:putative endopeptidase